MRLAPEARLRVKFSTHTIPKKPFFQGELSMRIILLALFLATVMLLQGCFPLAAAGVGATAVVLSDRRAPGVYVQDENLEWKVRVQIVEEFKNAHINVTSYNQSVLLTGQVPNEQMKKDIDAAMRTYKDIKNVTNELTVSGNSSLAARSSDTLLTTAVKARLINNGKVSPSHVKVVSESGVVFLMGIVSREEGDAAADVASNTSGVSRVVKVFEYNDVPKVTDSSKR
jgi:osmotically-inducible protein OsmY